MKKISIYDLLSVLLLYLFLVMDGYWIFIKYFNATTEINVLFVKMYKHTVALSNTKALFYWWNKTNLNVTYTIYIYCRFQFGVCVLKKCVHAFCINVCKWVCSTVLFSCTVPIQFCNWGYTGLIKYTGESFLFLHCPNSFCKIRVVCFFRGLWKHLFFLKPFLGRIFGHWLVFSY